MIASAFLKESFLHTCTSQFIPPLFDTKFSAQISLVNGRASTSNRGELACGDADGRQSELSCASCMQQLFGEQNDYLALHFLASLSDARQGYMPLSCTHKVHIKIAITSHPQAGWPMVHTKRRDASCPLGTPVFVLPLVNSLLHPPRRACPQTVRCLLGQPCVAQASSTV